jgi:hypothetical protein
MGALGAPPAPPTLGALAGSGATGVCAGGRRAAAETSHQPHLVLASWHV